MPAKRLFVAGCAVVALAIPAVAQESLLPPGFGNTSGAAPAQPQASQPPADGRFAGSHQADKDDWSVEAVGKLLHGQGYTAALEVGQKRFAALTQIGYLDRKCPAD